MVGRGFQSYEKRSFFSVFSRLDPFLQVFEKVKKCLVLELQKIIMVLSKIVFILFYEWARQRGVFIVMKDDYCLVFLAVWILFPKFLVR